MRQNNKKVDILTIIVIVLIIAGILLKAILPENNETVSNSGSAQQEKLTYKNYIGKKIGILTGSSFEAPSFEYFPDSEYIYYESLSDLIMALQRNKIDCFIEDEPVVKMTFLDIDDLSYLPEILKDEIYSFAFPKDSTKHDIIIKQFNEMLAELTESGELEALKQRWFSADSSDIKIDKSGLTGENGILTIGINPLNVPFSMIVDGEPEGYAIELTYLFCRKYGYDCKFEQGNLTSVLAGITSGKYDMCANSCTVTEERLEVMRFSDPIYKGGISVAVRAADMKGYYDTGKDNKNFWEKLKDSFERNFIREKRWKLVLEGIGTTCLITLLATIFGSVLAFLICMYRRSGSKLANFASDIYVKLFQGTPIVVLLMILYYVIFGNSDFNAKWIAVIGFSLNFGAYASEIMRSGIKSIDGGQREAALALGYSENQAFFRFIFPQAAVRFLPVYRGEIVSLLKSTSIVGYIAIQDLTKMSDIIRSRTYEAFFPLISTAIIYFILAWFISIGMNCILKRIDPVSKKKRNK